MSSDPIWPQLFLQAVLIFVNAFFAATEMSVISLNDNLLRKQAEEGDEKAQKLLKVVESPTRFLSTIQIGITLAGYLGSAFAAGNFATRITDWAAGQFALSGATLGLVNTLSVILITVVLSFFTLVFGELVPKRIAMQKGERIANMACGVILSISTIMRPVIWLLTISTNGVLRLLHIDPNAESEEVSEEEIRMMVDIGEERGAIETGERQMIENIFEFNNMTAEDVMIHRTDVVMLWADDSDEEIVRTIEETGLSRYPVYEEDADDVIGILNSRDYFLNARREEPRPVRELLRTAYFVPESVRTDVLFRDMQDKKVHLAIVVDEYGGTSGIITMEDLLEEIVGKIYDEFDPQDEQEITQLEPNLWRVSGSVDLEDLADELDVKIPEDEEYDTLAGLIFAQFTTIPEDGSQPEADVFGLHLKVEKLEDRRIEWALVSKQEPETQE